MATKGNGRRKPLRDQRRNTVALRFSDAELALVERVAAGKPVAAYLREVVLRHVARQRQRRPGTTG